MKFSGERQKARRVQQRRIQKKNTALECTAVSLLVAPAAPLPGWGSLSLLPVLPSATATAMAPILLYVKREHYSGKPDPSSQSSHLFVLQSLDGGTNGGANTIAITIPVIKVKLPHLNPQPSPFFATQCQELHQCHCLHHLIGSN